MKKAKFKVPRVVVTTQRYQYRAPVTRGPYQKRDPLTYAPIPHKSAVIMLRVSPAEKAAWDAAARQWSSSLSDWLRLAAAEYLELCASRAELRALATAPPPKKKRTGKRVA